MIMNALDSQELVTRETTDDVVLSVRDLRAWYGPALALHDVSIEVPRNQITALIGPSGCGKSTLLRCLNRMNDLVAGFRMEGKLSFEGEDLMAANLDVVNLRRRVGMVFQKPNPFPKSIYNNVAWGARINGYRGKMDDLVERSLRRAALWDEVKNKLHRSGLELSGGQQQRLCIARTLAVEPEVILMDEPCSALDPISTGAIEDLYSTTTQLTLAIATQAAGWEDQARANEETFFDFFTAQLNAYAAARDVAVGDAPITEAWIRTLHEIVTASQAT